MNSKKQTQLPCIKDKCLKYPICKHKKIIYCIELFHLYHQMLTDMVERTKLKGHVHLYNVRKTVVNVARKKVISELQQTFPNLKYVSTLRLGVELINQMEKDYFK